MADTVPLIPPDQPIDPKRVPILVHSLDRGPVINCILKMTSPIGKLRDSIAARQGIERDAFVLLYDGHLVYDNDTLESLAEYGVDEEEIRAGVRFEMNARQIGGCLS
ncbi:hypothetical protein A1Q1_01699 [Trichosporon asahii var. asahii CBS 2479]|uniref:Ubiquitin-like domain-containing protein n=1 Tax=Trichosporon asahii var. asahii (strain ATCC 90039 / CBS 2479 / JCM 2466 / KCTC 7840 / NBRC 103889/ NCYC 2677 / UAMH 7654) TaxID=1186058 RepID=J5QUS8_TRIAS|nr:hypothetical protein A1Q1_01699 [Trichosporon asahii var. asahii CBS 2479]EJT49218.1 hypothetical protein A1Q1_01699 [Trichosporon asahii var. asahii CBS 2479]